jgi:glycogen synthase
MPAVLFHELIGFGFIRRCTVTKSLHSCLCAVCHVFSNGWRTVLFGQSAGLPAWSVPVSRSGRAIRSGSRS